MLGGGADFFFIERAFPQFFFIELRLPVHGIHDMDTRQSIKGGGGWGGCKSFGYLVIFVIHVLWFRKTKLDRKKSVSCHELFFRSRVPVLLVQS